MKKEEIAILFRQHYGPMIRLARRMLYDDEESRDVVSEVFATLIKTDILSKNMEGYLMASVRTRRRSEPKRCGMPHSWIYAASGERPYLSDGGGIYS